MKPAAHWHALAAAFEAPVGHWIDGDWTPGGDDPVQIVNPADGSVLAEAADGGAAMVSRAIDAAERRFRSGEWSRAAPRVRGEVLHRLADLVEADAERFALCESLTVGKPIRDAVLGDVPQAVAALRFFAELPDKLRGETTASDGATLHYVLREPIGVVGCIVPWNFPLAMAVWKAAPALAAGNCVVLKPADQTPWSALLLAELFVRAGGPAGVFNVVAGRGDTAGRALALDRRVRRIAFTGSTRVGRLIHEYVSQSSLKTVSLECGGKSPQIVLDDVADLDVAVDAAIFGAYGNAGQVCNAGSRLILEAGIHDAFSERFSERVRETVVMGDLFDPETTMGPVISAAAHARIRAAIEDGRRGGARLAFGGGRPEGFERGFFIEPTLFTETTSAMRIAQDEVFGPVATVLRAEGPDDVVRIANDSDYGLAAAVWGRDLDRVHKLARDIEAGVVWVNCFDAGDMTQPFGGWKDSGQGWDKGVDALIGYTQPKSVWIALGQAG